MSTIETDGWHLASEAPVPRRVNVIGYDARHKEQVFAYLEDSGTWMAWQQTTLDEGWNQCPGISHWRYKADDPVNDETVMDKEQVFIGCGGNKWA